MNNDIVKGDSERGHNARHKSLTSTLNIKQLKTSELCLYLYVWTPRFNVQQKIKNLIIWFKKWLTGCGDLASWIFFIGVKKVTIHEYYIT